MTFRSSFPVVILVLAALLVLAGGMMALVRSPALDRWVYRQQFEQSTQLIESIEKFELEAGRLPTQDEVAELKIRLALPANERCPCYQVDAEEGGRFIVWFGYRSTGSSMVYASHTAEWSPRP